MTKQDLTEQPLNWQLMTALYLFYMLHLATIHFQLPLKEEDWTKRCDPDWSQSQEEKNAKCDAFRTV